MRTVERVDVLNRSKETPFQSWVIRYAKFHGWRVTAMKDSRSLWWGTDKGVPDLLLVRGKRLVFIECKTAKGRDMPWQTAWREDLLAAGAEAYCFRPADQDAVRRVLE